jgi:hypothetical protein
MHLRSELTNYCVVQVSSQGDQVSGLDNTEVLV